MTKKKKKILFINLIVFIILFIATDLIVGHFKIPYNFNHFRIKHPYYHHGMMKNAAQHTSWGRAIYEINTNSLGFIDSANYKVKLKTDDKRILIIGDSHSEGVGVEFEKTFAGILQKQVQSSGIEILNASAVSYSPKIHYLKTDYFLNKKELDVDEVWVFVDISDLQNEIAYENFHPKPEGIFFTIKQGLKKFLILHSFTYYTIKSRQEQKKVDEFLDKMKEFSPKNITDIEKNTIKLYEDFFRDFEDDEMLRSPHFHGVGTWYYDSACIDLANKGLDLGQKNMQQFVDICKEKNIHIKLSVHPWQTQILKQDTSDYYVETWRKFCNKNDIDFINLFPVFITEQRPHIVNDLYFIPKDNHWNEKGHKKVAQYLFSLIND